VSLLVKAFPAGVSHKDRAGQLPLHWASENKAILEVATILLEACSKHASERDNLGRTPLHVGSAGHASLAVLDALHDAHPEGMRPLQVGPSLFSRHSEQDSPLAAAWQRDLDGRIPLHHAAASRLSAESALLLRSPATWQLHLDARKRCYKGALQGRTWAQRINMVQWFVWVLERPTFLSILSLNEGIPPVLQVSHTF
jgi:ankyrin repeat protein